MALQAQVEAAPKSCTAAYKHGLKLEQAGKLRDAQKSFSACSKAACGGSVRRDCILRFGQLGSDIPSVVPVVTDPTGEPVLEVKVTMDGETLTSKIDGRAVPVDPGLHEFTFSAAAGSNSQKIVILQGQRNRPISVTLGAQRPAAAAAPIARAAVTPPPVAAQPSALVEPEAAVAPPSGPAAAVAVDEKPDEPSSTRSSPRTRSVAPYLLSVVGLAGVGGFAAMTYWGRKDNDMLSQCTPNCAPESVDHVRKLYTRANISLGVGLAALGVATYLFVRSGPSSTEVAAKPAPRRYGVDVVPVPSGAVASLRGGF